MRKIFTLMSILAVMVSFSFAQITIDGDMLDWADIPAADQGNTAEELGDMTTGPMFDVKDLYITSDTTNLYFRLTIDPSTTFSAGFTDPHTWGKIEIWLDTNLEDTTGLGWGWWPMAVDYMVELDYAINPDTFVTEGTILHFTGSYTASIWPDDFDSVGVAQMAVNDNDNEIEVSIPREAVNAGTNVRPMIYSVGDWVWASEDYIPNDQSTGNDPAWVIDYSFVYGVSNVQIGGEQINTDITIDGDMLDWADIPAADVDEAAEELGDMSTGPMFDVKDLYLTSDTTNLYTRLTIDPSTTFSAGFTDPHTWGKIELWLDTDLSDTTGLGWGWWPMALDYMIELDYAINPDTFVTEATILHFTGDYTASIWPDDFDSVGVAQVAVNDNDNEIEVSIPREAVNAGTDVRPMIYSVGDWVWASEDYIPNDQASGNDPPFVINYNFVNGTSVIQMSGKVETAIEDPKENQLPSDFSLNQNYPNPFNPVTHISFSLPQTDNITLTIYDALGRKVTTLIDNRSLTPGNKNVKWNGTDPNGKRVSSGIYFYKISGSKYSAAKKMVLMK